MAQSVLCLRIAAADIVDHANEIRAKMGHFMRQVVKDDESAREALSPLLARCRRLLAKGTPAIEARCPAVNHPPRADVCRICERPRRSRLSRCVS